MNWLEPAGLGVEIAEVVVHEADEPDTVGDLFDADQLTRKHGTQVSAAATALAQDPATLGLNLINSGLIQALAEALRILLACLVDGGAK